MYNLYKISLLAKCIFELYDACGIGAQLFASFLQYDILLFVIHLIFSFFGSCYYFFSVEDCLSIPCSFFQPIKFEDFIIFCSQVMSGMLVIFMVLNDLMWTALGALHLGNPNQRYGQSTIGYQIVAWGCKLWYEYFLGWGMPRWVDSYHDLLFSHGTLEDVSIQRSHSSGINPVDWSHFLDGFLLWHAEISLYLLELDPFIQLEMNQPTSVQ